MKKIKINNNLFKRKKSKIAHKISIANCIEIYLLKT